MSPGVIRIGEDRKSEPFQCGALAVETELLPGGVAVAPRENPQPGGGQVDDGGCPAPGAERTEGGGGAQPLQRDQVSGGVAQHIEIPAVFIRIRPGVEAHHRAHRAGQGIPEQYAAFGQEVAFDGCAVAGEPFFQNVGGGEVGGAGQVAHLLLIRRPDRGAGVDVMKVVEQIAVPGRVEPGAVGVSIRAGSFQQDFFRFQEVAFGRGQVALDRTDRRITAGRVVGELSLHDRQLGLFDHVEIVGQR